MHHRPTEAELRYIKTLEDVTVRGIRYRTKDRIQRLWTLMHTGKITKHRVATEINRLKRTADLELDEARRRSRRLADHYRSQGLHYHRIPLIVK